MTADFEDQTYVFIVRIWAEHREIKNAKPEWRGAVEPISSTDKLYFTDIDELTEFIMSVTGAHRLRQRPPFPSEIKSFGKP